MRSHPRWLRRIREAAPGKRFAFEGNYDRIAHQFAQLVRRSTTIDREPRRQAGSLERANLRQTNPPRLTAVSCRSPTASERASSPIGGTASALFSCRITVEGESARFDVQVLPNGCFVAERQPAGQAVYGCGVARTSG